MDEEEFNLEELLAMADDAIGDFPDDKSIECPACERTVVVPITRKLRVCPGCYAEWRKKYTEKYA